MDVFDIQTSRNVLIIAPIGDAVGFRAADVNRGISLVLKQIRGLNPPLVVVDLGNSTYFGSVIIGALVTFAEQVAGAGGAFVLCNVSDDMQTVLNVMQVGENWQFCDTRREAIRAARKAGS